MKNIARVLCFFMFAGLFLQFANQQKENIITCEIKGLEKGDKIILTFGTVTEELTKVDSIIYDGQQSFNLKTTERDVMAAVWIVLKGNTFNRRISYGTYFFLEGFSNLRLTGEVVGGRSNTVIKGGLYNLPEMKEILRSQEEFSKVYRRANDLRREIRDFRGLKEKQDSVKLLFDKVCVEKEKYGHRQDSIKRTFVKKHPNFAFSAELLHYDYELKRSKDFRKYEDAFMRLSHRVRKSRAGQNVAKYITARRATEVGGVAPNFSIVDVEGKDISLSDYRGKYLLLEFWGTWCGGCIEMLPHLQELRDNVSDEKMGMLSIACGERSEEGWRKFLKEKQINWRQALSKTERLQQAYGVQSYPTFFLLNPEGEIIHKGFPSSEIMEKIKNKNVK